MQHIVISAKQSAPALGHAAAWSALTRHLHLVQDTSFIMSIRTLIVDNQPVVRRGLKLFLSTDPAINIVGEADSGKSGLALALGLEPDLILMDLLMSEMDGIAATRAIRQQQPQVRIIALSSSSDYATIASALLAGADTYLHKSRKLDLLLETIKGVAQGRVMLAPDILIRMLDELPVPDTAAWLDEGDLMLLSLLAEGSSEEDIAARLGRDLPDLTQRIQTLQSSLDSETRLLMVLRAMQLGLIARPTPG